MGWCTFPAIFSKIRHTPLGVPYGRRINPQKNRGIPVTPVGILGLNYIEKNGSSAVFVAAGDQQKNTRRE